MGGRGPRAQPGPPEAGGPATWPGLKGWVSWRCGDVRPTPRPLGGGQVPAGPKAARVGQLRVPWASAPRQWGWPGSLVLRAGVALVGPRAGPPLVRGAGVDPIPDRGLGGPDTSGVGGPALRAPRGCGRLVRSLPASSVSAVTRPVATLAEPSLRVSCMAVPRVGLVAQETGCRAPRPDAWMNERIHQSKTGTDERRSSALPAKPEGQTQCLGTGCPRPRARSAE